MALPYILPTSVLIALVLYALYSYLKPKPIPGSIPYIPASAESIFGDIPDMLAHQNETKETISFLAERCRELNSPIAQVFMRPRYVVVRERGWQYPDRPEQVWQRSDGLESPSWRIETRDAAILLRVAGPVSGQIRTDTSQFLGRQALGHRL